MINYDRLPEHMIGAARRYVEEGIKPGGFLTAILCNSLMGAYANADNINIASMQDWVMWLYNDVPSACCGSMGKVNAWCDRGGLHGESPQDAGSDS